MEDLYNRLQWRHLKLLHGIDQLGQLSTAAEHMSVTQPAASRMLAEIEVMTGRPVFERTPKGMISTPFGKILVAHAGDLIHGLVTAVADVASFEKALSGSVRIGAVTGAAVAHVVPALQVLQRETMDADIHVDVGPSDALIQGLMAGKHDYVLARVPPNQDPRQLDVMLGKVEVVHFMVRNGHTILDRISPSLSDLSELNWVTQPTGAPMRQAIQEAFIAHDIAFPERIMNSTSFLVTIAHLMSSDAVAPVSSEVAALLQSDGAHGLRTFQTREPIVVAPYHLIQRKGFEPIPIVKRFREILSDTLRLD